MTREHEPHGLEEVADELVDLAVHVVRLERDEVEVHAVGKGGRELAHQLFELVPEDGDVPALAQADRERQRRRARGPRHRARGVDVAAVDVRQIAEVEELFPAGDPDHGPAQLLHRLVVPRGLEHDPLVVGADVAAGEDDVLARRGAG